jgi:hypothetical protein
MLQERGTGAMGRRHGWVGLVGRSGRVAGRCTRAGFARAPQVVGQFKAQYCTTVLNFFRII